MPLSVDTPAPPKKTMFWLCEMIFSNFSTIFNTSFVPIDGNQRKILCILHFVFHISTVIFRKHLPQMYENILREHPVLAFLAGGTVSGGTVEPDRTGGGFAGGQTAGQQGRRHTGQHIAAPAPGKTGIAGGVEDDAFIQELVEAMESQTMPVWDFQGVLKGRNGTEERMVYRECIPSGQVDLQNITVGDVIKRAWNFAVNRPPKLQNLLALG